MVLSFYSYVSRRECVSFFIVDIEMIQLRISLVWMSQYDLACSAIHGWVLVSKINEIKWLFIIVCACMLNTNCCCLGSFSYLVVWPYFNLTSGLSSTRTADILSFPIIIFWLWNWIVAQILIDFLRNIYAPNALLTYNASYASNAK